MVVHLYVPLHYTKTTNEMKKTDKVILAIVVFTLIYVSIIYTSEFFQALGFVYGFGITMGTMLVLPWLMFIFITHDFVKKTALFQLIEDKSFILGALFEFTIHALNHLIVYVIIPLILIMGYKESLLITDSFEFYKSIILHKS